MAVNCNEGTLSIYIPDQYNPWDISKILFLFRRIGFSVKFKEVKNYLNFNPSDLIDQIFEEALNMPLCWCYKLFGFKDFFLITKIIFYWLIFEASIFKKSFYQPC